MVMNTTDHNVPKTMISSDVEIQNAGQLCDTTVETKKPETIVAENEESVDEESDDPPPSPRITRARHRYIVMVDSDTDTDTRSLRRRSRQNSIKSSPHVDTKKRKEEKAEKKNDTTPIKTRVKKKKKESEEEEEEDEEGDGDGEYVHVNVGDCVLLDSGDPDNHFIALVSSVQLSANHKDKIGTFTAQWYYKPDDIRDEVRESIPGGVGIKEVFLSPHKDKNSIDAVIGTCDVYSKEEFDEIQMAEQRGFREKSSRLYFMCRYKYYPNRPPKKALEKLSVDFIRGGLGPQKPKIGEMYQAIIPSCLTDDEKQQELIHSRDVDERIPWKYPVAPCGQAKQVWSSHIVSAHEVLFRQFREMLNLIRFAMGNIIKIYHSESSTCSLMRGMVHQYRPMDSITIGLSTGEIQSVLLSEVYSPLTDDVAFNYFYQSRFNLTRAIYECTQELIGLQQEERVAFLQEIELRKEKERDLKRRKQE